MMMGEPFLTTALLAMLAVSCLLAAGGCGQSESAAEPVLRVISYNVLEGFEDAEPRREAVARWLADQKSDVVALEELNGYTKDRLREEARAWGHDHAVLLKETGYPTGLTSRTPIRDAVRVLDGFHHGLVRARTAGVTFYVVHLSPSDVEVRIREAEQILEGLPATDDHAAVAGVRATMAMGEPVVVLGDSNSVSPLDRDFYSARFVRETRARGDADSGEVSPDADPLRYRTIETFLASGLVDVVRRRHDDVGRIMSCPTPLWKPELSRDELRRDQRRIDYVLVSPDLAARCVRADVINDTSMDWMSDHYPVVTEFRRPAPASP